METIRDLDAITRKLLSLKVGESVKIIATGLPKTLTVDSVQSYGDNVHIGLKSRRGTDYSVDGKPRLNWWRAMYDIHTSKVTGIKA